MKPEELFGVFVRTAALPLIWYGIVQLVTGIYIRVAIRGLHELKEQGEGIYIGWGVGYLLVGICVLRLANYIVKFAYPGSAQTPTASPPQITAR